MWRRRHAPSPERAAPTTWRWPGPGRHLRGEYLEFARPNRLRFSWSWDQEKGVEVEATVFFKPDDDTTRLIVTRTYSTTGERGGYVEGWRHSLPRLASTL